MFLEHFILQTKEDFCTNTLFPSIYVFGITSLRENAILKTDAKEKADICNRQFQTAFTQEGDSDRPSKGACPFSSMGT